MRNFFAVLFVLNASFAVINFIMMGQTPLTLFVCIMNAIVAYQCLVSLDDEIERDLRWNELLDYERRFMQ